MWKFQNFFCYSGLILRDINFGEIRRSKTAIFEALDFVHLANKIQPSESAKIHEIQKSQPLNLLK